MDVRPNVVPVVGVLVGLCCLGFALVNVVFEVTGHFDRGRYAEYSSAFSVLNWLVVVLKVAGAAVALLSVARRPWPVPAAVVTVSLWGAFATLAGYALGSVAEAVGMAVGLTGTVDGIDLAGIVYVLFFLLVAAGFGVLAVSYSRRHGTRRRLAVLGVLGGPVLLGLVLVAVPALLAAVGLMPSP
ncbi:hypothetical protein [Actinophytocola gossypii]|uniref:Uncharacterized protein n=1 Tax=Actinophytocola gossypii TaxID=2812003 RepID=A0ABT2J2V5_9PSEU|nr:hypothetical protein [Actinophytocola gossypii]MCT2582197.1 hypothetical protein [Actinophytocola gossypii]